MIGFNARTGRAVSGLDHLTQSVADILTTPIGTRIERRDYGSLIPELIDRPLNGTTRLHLFAATAAALLRWEPRLRVNAIQLHANAAGKAELDLECTVDGRNVELSIRLREAP